jgi:hypothetical protein
MDMEKLGKGSPEVKPVELEALAGTVRRSGETANGEAGIKRQALDGVCVSFNCHINQPYFNLLQEWIIKGCVCAWNNFKRNRFIQPKGGFFDGYIGGKGVFTNETIREWLPLMDEDMEAYHQKYCTGAKPKSRIKKGRYLENIA